jgi:hypothetical protein
MHTPFFMRFMLSNILSFHTIHAIFAVITDKFTDKFYDNTYDLHKGEN